MRAHLGERQLEGGILRQLFIKLLPITAQTILASANPPTSLEELAELADRILEGQQPTISAGAQPPALDSVLSEQLALLNTQLNDLRTELSTFKKQVRARSASRTHRGRSKDRSGTSQHSQSPGPNQASTELCWYLAKYGSQAHKCVSPCSFTSDLEQGNATPRE